ncbi:hypothetical protein DRO69_09850, partial [Candidatus Bathyarchaeota archaeon]
MPKESPEPPEELLEREGISEEEFWEQMYERYGLTREEFWEMYWDYVREVGKEKADEYFFPEFEEEEEEAAMKPEPDEGEEAEGW